MKKFYFLLLSLVSMAACAQTYNYTVFSSAASGISSNINSIKTDGNGTLWLTSFSGISSYNGSTFTHYTPENSGLQTNSIIEAEIDSSNKKWMATYSDGVIVFNGSTFTNYKTSNSALPSNTINDIAIDGQNNVWVATPAGLAKFNGTAWTSYTTANSNIGTNNITSVGIDSNNVVWITDTNSFLKKFNGTTFTHIGDQAARIVRVKGTDVYATSPMGFIKYANSIFAGITTYGSSSCMLDCYVADLDIDENNKVWIGFQRECSNGGIQNFTDCANYTETTTGTPLNYITCLEVQNSSTIWSYVAELGLVKMSRAAACPQPTGFSVTNINTTSVTVNWNAPSPAPSSYVVVYNTSPNFGGISGNTTTTSKTLEGLNPNSDYYWWVASNCGNTISDYVLGGFFRTAEVPTGACFKAVAGGSYYSFGIKTDGTLWAWGANDGRLGENTPPGNYTAPKRIGNAANWESIATCVMHSAGIKTDGTLWTWGFNNNGGLGNGTVGAATYTTTQMGTANNWKSVAVGLEHTVAIKTDGTLWAWGRNTLGEVGNGNNEAQVVAIQIGTATNWKSVSAGEEHTVALKTDGTLWSWGYNGQGQLGDGTTTSRNAPAQVGTDTNWQSISTGQLHTLAVKTNGTLWAFGYNDYGQVGTQTGVRVTTPTQVGTATNWKTVDGGRDFSLATRTDGSLYAWGRNTWGQLGDGSTTNRATPVRVGVAADWQTISGGFGHSLALKTDGSLYTWGYNVSGALGNGTVGIGTHTTVPGNINCPLTTTLEVGDFAAANAMKVYPNPVNDILNIAFETTITNVSIFNVLGQEVIAKPIHAKETKIDVSALHAGTYFVKVNADGEVKTLKIIKK